MKRSGQLPRERGKDCEKAWRVYYNARLRLRWRIELLVQELDARSFASKKEEIFENLDLPF